MSKTGLRIRRVAITAVFLSIALILKTYFSFSIPLMGENGMRVGISGIFSIMPSILFGPLYGGLASALVDLLGYLLKPTGPYMPLMTVTAFLGGFLRGGIWVLLRRRGDKRLRIAVLAAVLLVFVLGIWNTWSLQSDGVTNGYYERLGEQEPDTDSMHLISRMLITRTASTSNPDGNLSTYLTFTTWGLFSFSGLGLVLVSIDFLLSKIWLKRHKERISGAMGILIAMTLSGLIVTTLNTIILRELLYPSWKLLPFLVVWVPRAIEEIVSNAIKAYFVTLLYDLFQNQKSLRRFLSWQK